ncbi:MAG: hypothetical protein KKH28_08950 [Elusimicrobia bacterium]|nr:hypothetical protein [Elusimicrobiota bacterium]
MNKRYVVIFAFIAFLCCVNDVHSKEVVTIAIGGLSFNEAVKDGIQSPIPSPIRKMSSAVTKRQETENICKNVMSSYYLKNALNTDYAVEWARDYEKSKERGQGLLNVYNTYRDAANRNPSAKVRVICHSHGCGLLLEAMRKYPAIRLNKVVSIGTMVSRGNLGADVLRFLSIMKEKKPENVGSWTNFYSMDDKLLSRPLGNGIKNIELNNIDHSDYFTNSIAKKAVMRELMRP